MKRKSPSNFKSVGPFLKGNLYSWFLMFSKMPTAALFIITKRLEVTECSLVVTSKINFLNLFNTMGCYVDITKNEFILSTYMERSAEHIIK